MDKAPINIIDNAKELFIRIIQPLLKSFPYLIAVITAVFLLLLGILSVIFS